MNLAETLLQAQPRKFGVWPSVWKLLRLRIVIWWNTFRRAKLRSKIGTIVLTLLALGGIAFLFFVSSLLLRFLQSPELARYIDPSQFLAVIPGLVLTLAFVMTLLTNFGVLLQALFLSRDMDFLVHKPIPMRAVFLAKMIEAILPTFMLICAFSLPVLFGMASARNYSLLYYPLLVLTLALLALAAGGLASILVMAVVRVIPARRVAEVLGFLVAVSSILCGQSGNIINAMDPDRDDFGAALSFFSQLELGWSPISWAGRGLDLIGNGDLLNGFGLALPALLLAGLVFAASLYTAEQLYYTGWSSMQGSVRKKRPARAAEPRAGARPSPLAGLARLLPPPVRGVMIKDALLLRRDPRNLSQLITPLILGVVMIFTTQGGGRGATRALNEAGLQDVGVYGVLALAVFVGWMLMFYLSTMSFSREGKNYWFLKASPIRPSHLLAAKFLVAYLPSMIFSLLYLVVAFFFRGIDWAHFPYTALVLAMTIAGANGISLAFGVGAANLVWDSPQRQRLRGKAGCFVFPAVFGYEVVNLALFLAPVILFQVFTGEAPLLSYVVGGLLGTAAGVAAVFLPLYLVAPRIARIGEEE